ncbi:tyrosyl-DNA phosphodiesterase [Aureococcus anophagefferens]|nr:tyrosyl-DNA phosphodiesterase [Aureococcus anophagefferens]
MWVCGTCTLLNESDSFLQCSACAALRPAKRKALDDDQGVSKRQAIDLCDSDDDGGDAAVVFELDDDEAAAAALRAELAAQDEQAAAAAELVTQQDEAFARSLHAAQVTPDGDDGSLALARELAAEDAPSVEADLAMARAMDLGDKLSVARNFERDRLLALEAQEQERHALKVALGVDPKAAPPPRDPPPRRVFVGDGFIMNELDEKIRTQEGARDAPYKAQTVTSEELLWHTPSIQRALFTSYGVNYEFLAHLLRGSPCVYTPGKVVVVDEYDHSKYAPAVHPASRANPFTIVHPKFYEDGASQHVRSRLEKGTMHPKLWILCFADFCRVIVASSNLGAYDNKVNNQYWVHDFPRGRRLEAAAREHVLYDSEPRGDAEGADEALAAAVGDAAARRLVAFADGGLAEHREAGLSKDERHAVHRWCERRGLASASHDDAGEARRILWDEILRSYDLTPPEGVHFIGSVPGFRRGAFAEAFGHRAIRLALAREGLTVARAEFANSSLGRLDNKVFLRGFATSLFGAGDLDRLKIVWPSQATACRSSRKLMLHAMTEDKGTAQMNGPDDRIWNAAGFPRARFHHYHAPSDRQTLHHTKMLACFDGDDRLVAVVGGSHNCSGAAWGVGEDNMSVIMSYEAGVLVACGAGRADPRRCPGAAAQGRRARRRVGRGARAADGLGAAPRPFRVFRGPFPADTDGGLRAVVARRTDVPVFRESLEAYVDRVGRKKEQDELKKLGKLCAQGLSPNRQAARTLHAGERVFVDHGTAHFDYDHARYGKIHVTEYRLSDGSGFAHGQRRADSASSRPATATPSPCSPSSSPRAPVRRRRSGPRSTTLASPRAADKFAGLWLGVGGGGGVVHHAEVVARKIFDFVRFPAIGAVVRGERCAEIRAEAAAAALQTPRRCSRCSRRRGGADEALVRVRKRDEKKRRDALAPLENAKAAAAWVRRNYDVVVIEPEGTLKRPNVLTIRPEPLSASELSRDKADHFKDEAVPLLRELVAEPRVAVALATVWGQSVADPSLAPGQRKKEDRLKQALSDLDARLDRELDGRAGFDVLVSWRCSDRHAQLPRVLPRPRSRREAAAGERRRRRRRGRTQACARRIFDEDEAFEGGAPPSTVVRRAAEWSPEFAGPFRLQTAVALAGLRRDIKEPRALVVGAEHDTAATARAAKLDYIGVGKLCSGTGLDWKKVRWDSDAAGDDAIINFPNG